MALTGFASLSGRKAKLAAERVEETAIVGEDGATNSLQAMIVWSVDLCVLARHRDVKGRGPLDH